MRNLCWYLTAAVSLVLLVAAPARVAAEGRGTGPAGAYLDDAGTPTAVAHDAVNADAQRSFERPDCVWTAVVADDTRTAVYDADGSRVFSETGRWLQLICGGVLRYVDGWPLIAERGRVDPALLAEEAARAVTISAPAIASSPPLTKALFVRVPTWLWVDPAWWRRYEATASAGRVTATVSASPARTVWSMGDGSVVACDGPGVPWSVAAGDAEPSCGHTYRRSSAQQPGGAYPVRVDVELAVTWTSNVGVGGSLGPIHRTASAAARVAEIQAVGSEGVSR
jgi:hypothetical protein